MDQNLVMVKTGTSVQDAVGAMLSHKVWSVLVAEKGLPLGVVTDRDVLRSCDGNKSDMSASKVEDIMTSPLITIDADAPVGEVMAKMIKKNVRRLYVVEEGKVVGKVTRNSVFKNIFDLVAYLTLLSDQT